jgi:hypothetical protein
VNLSKSSSQFKFVFQLLHTHHFPSMSMFFFRLRNLKRDEEKKKEKQKIEQTYHFSRQRRGAKVFKTTSSSLSSESDQLTAPSRLFERTSINPRDSMDAVALQIPRLVWFCCVSPTCTTLNPLSFFRTHMRRSKGKCVIISLR